MFIIYRCFNRNMDFEMTVNIQNLLYEKYGKEIQLVPVKSGKNKDIYIVTTAKEKVIILVNKRRFFMKKYRSFMSNNLQKNLFLRGFNAPEVKDIYKIAGKTFYCHDYIEGHKIEKCDKETAYLLGKTVAQFHVAANQSPINIPDLPLLYRGIYIAKKMRYFIRNILYRFKYPLWSVLPKGICHYDLNFNNFIFSNGKVFLIDYDRQRYWPFACELERFFKNKGSQEYAKDFLDGYNSVRKLTEEERKFLHYE